MMARQGTLSGLDAVLPAVVMLGVPGTTSVIVWRVTSATPWWGTLVVAVLALAGVLWNQYRADVRESERITKERVDRDRDHRFGLYRDIVVSFDEVQRVLRTAPTLDAVRQDELLRQFTVVLSTARFVAPPSVREQVDKLVVGWHIVLKMHALHGASSQAFAAALSTVDGQMSELLAVMRADIGIEP